MSTRAQAKRLVKMPRPDTGVYANMYAYMRQERQMVAKEEIDSGDSGDYMAAVLPLAVIRLTG
jgi:hypothetical protein